MEANHTLNAYYEMGTAHPRSETTRYDERSTNAYATSIDNSPPYDEEKKAGIHVTTVETPCAYEEEPSSAFESGIPPQHSLSEKWWVWEFTAWVICMLALLGMIALLIPLNGKPVPKWAVSATWKDHSLRYKGKVVGFNVSLNSILSLFSTIVKSTIMIPVAASISQLKWVWFSQDRKLVDFQKFEAAKGGPLGAILLLWAMKGKSLVCLGALITIASLALDFAFQQLIAYPPAPVHISTAHMAATPIYSAYSLGTARQADGIQPLKPDSRMLLAFNIGSTNLNTTININPDCSTGNCTWPYAYTTAAVCSACQDATAYLTEDCGDSSAPYCNYALGDGVSLAGIVDINSTYFTTYQMSSNTTSVNLFANITNPIAIISTIQTSYGNVETFNATANQCTLFWCAHKYRGSVTQNILSEELVGVYHPNATLAGEESDLHLTIPSSFLADTAQNGSDATFIISGNSSYGVSNYTFSQLFNIHVEQTPTGHPPQPDVIADYFWPLNATELNNAMSYLAGNMTNAIRMSNLAAEGIVWQDQPQVEVVWWWFIFPGAMIAFSLLFLILTMLSASRSGATLWKSSALAAFYHPLATEGRSKLNQATGPKSLEKIAGELHVRAERTEKGVRFVVP